MDWHRLASITGRVGVAVGLLLVGWAIHDFTASAGGDWMAAGRNAWTFSGDAGKIALGAFIGAAGAWIVAWQNRQEAREARFANRELELSLRVIDEFLACSKELMAQVFNRSLPGEPVETSLLPKVRDSIDMRRALIELELIANSQEVSTAGQVYADWLEQTLDEFRFQSPRDAVGLVKAKGLPFEAREALLAQLENANDLHDRFVNAVRRDLGRVPLKPTLPAPPAGIRDSDAPGI